MGVGQGLAVFDKLSLVQADDSFGAFGGARVVGYQDYGLLQSSLELAE